MGIRTRDLLHMICAVYHCATTTALTSTRYDVVLADQIGKLLSSLIVLSKTSFNRI